MAVHINGSMNLELCIAKIADTSTTSVHSAYSCAALVLMLDNYVSLFKVPFTFNEVVIGGFEESFTAYKIKCSIFSA